MNYFSIGDPRNDVPRSQCWPWRNFPLKAATLIQVMFSMTVFRSHRIYQ